MSIIAYLPSSWGLNEHAETLVLDSATDTGLCVRPRPGRIVVMDQDVMHRVSAPSDAAGRPRYYFRPCLYCMVSLFWFAIWNLVALFLPIPPTDIGIMDKDFMRFVSTASPAASRPRSGIISCFCYN